MRRKGVKKPSEVIIAMKEGQIFRGKVESLTPEGIILEGYCSRLCFVDMLSCRDFKREIDYLNPWAEPTHMLATLTGFLVLRGSCKEVEAMRMTFSSEQRPYYRNLCAIPSKPSKGRS